MEFTRMLTRRTIMLLLLTTVIVLFTLYTNQSGSEISIFDNVLTSTYNIRLKSEPHPTSEVMSLEQTHHRKEWSPYMDILSENDVMKDKPLRDVKQALSSQLSRVVIKGNSKEYRIGDEIRISILALDGYGKIRKRGGDQFRVRIFEQRFKASASGYVVDHKNGSYTAVTRALWSGTPSISIINAFPREVVRAWYYTMNKVYLYVQDDVIIMNSLQEHLVQLTLRKKKTSWKHSSYYTWTHLLEVSTILNCDGLKSFPNKTGI